ncbi:S-layer homology domain-containing protein [Anaerotignum sp.]
MKKLITFATAASLLLGSMGVTAYGAAFVDIDTVTWSGFKPFLNQAAELGLMSGYEENGKRYCKPRNNVTYCETVQLMYSIMKAYSKQDVNDATVTKWKPVISAYNIPEWAYKATAYGLENSILTTAELNKLQDGTKYANREDVGVIFGKALDTVNGYDIKSGVTLVYDDASQVSAAAVPYLELLYRANLMVGDSDNKFNPKNNITRAEMAVLSVKSYNKLVENKTDSSESKTASTATGTVTSSMVMQNGDLFITLSTSNGTNLSLFGTKGDVTAKYDGSKISFADIGTGDTVKVTYEGQYMSAIEVTNSKKGINKTTEKTFELVDVSDSKVTVKDGSSETKYYLDDDVEVKLDGKKSTISKLQKALEDANYDVTLTLDQEEYVLEIVASMNENNPTNGLVTDVDDDKITIKAGSKEYTYTLADDVEIEYDGKSMTFSKFEKNYDEYSYMVSLKLDKNNEVDEIIIESMEDEYNGTLTFLNSNRIEFEAGGDTYEYDLADDVTVKVDGKKSTVSALRESYRDGKGYVVSVDVDRNDEVTEIIATSKYAGNSTGELSELDKDELTIVSDDTKYTYDLADDVDVTINGKSKDLEDLMDYVKNYTFTVKLSFDSKGDVCEIEATLAEAKDGYLRDLVEDAKTITVTAAGMNLKLDLASSVKVTLDGDEVTLTKLNSELDYVYGDSRIYVELTYNSSGAVKEVTAFWEDYYGELVEVDTKNDEVTVKIGSKKETFEIGSKAEFVYKLASTVDEDDYKKNLKYDDDLDGLQDFLDDCDDAKDDCMAALTKDSKGKIVRIRAIAE